MTKGVNRQVLEIHETGSEYFEKAMFFVKPEYSHLSEKRLTSAATQSVKMQDTRIPPTKKREVRSRLLLAAKLTAAAGVGAALTAIIK